MFFSSAYHKKALPLRISTLAFLLGFGLGIFWGNASTQEDNPGAGFLEKFSPEIELHRFFTYVANCDGSIDDKEAYKITSFYDGRDDGVAYIAAVKYFLLNSVKSDSEFEKACQNFRRNLSAPMKMMTFKMAYSTALADGNVSLAEQIALNKLTSCFGLNLR